MARISLIGAAAVAAIAVAGCCDKSKCKPEVREEAKQEPAKQEAVKQEAKDPNEVVLAVNGATLTRGQLDADIAKIVAAQGDKIPAEQLEYAKVQIGNMIAQEFITENVLVKKAQELNYSATDEEIKAREAEILKSVARGGEAPKSIDEVAEKSPLGKDRALANIRNGVIIDNMIKAEVSGKNAKDYTGEAQKIIDGIKERNAKLASPEEALKKIEGLKKQLDETPADKVAEKFAELAKEHSACPSGRKGGDLGEFTHGMMVPEFDKVAFEQEIGVVSAPVKTQFGYHLVLTTKKTPAVEATNDNPAEPEKVQASHILIKTDTPQEVPDIERVKSVLRQQAEGGQVRDFIMDIVRKANVQASDDLKHLLPPPAPEEKDGGAVESPAE